MPKFIVTSIKSNKVYEDQSKTVTSTSDYEKKILVGIGIFRKKYFDFIQSYMNKSGFLAIEKSISHPSFTKVVLLSLNEIAVKLQNYKMLIAENLEENEICCIEIIKQREKIVKKSTKDLKLIETFNTNFTLVVKNVMIDSGFHVAEAGENHICFITFLSIVFRSLVQMFVDHEIYLKSFQKEKNENNILTPLSSSNARMFQISDEILRYASSVKLIKASERFLLYCVSSFSHVVAIKVLKSEFSCRNDIERLNNEYKIANMNIHPSLRYSYRRTTYQDKEAVLLEWAEGCPVSNIPMLNIESFLQIAREIASVLLAIHNNGIILLNLSCDHILIEKETKTVKIVSCGRAKKMVDNIGPLSFQELQENDLRCISPEQTGRLCNNVDFRSDFYSLGVVFYKLLSGKYPFEDESILKLLHKHTLEKPIPVSIVNPKIPAPIGAMVSKLMEKSPDKRYHTMKGIVHDIDLFISEYSINENLSHVQYGTHDQPDTLIIPQKLYGRDTELSTLISVIDRSIETSSLEIAFIVGNSGTGKSRLISELNKYIIGVRGRILFGKFDQVSDEPFSALIQAISGFCDELLLENENDMSRYKNKVKESLGDEGKILTDLVPNLTKIIGEQPPLSQAFGKGAKNRFNYLLSKFFDAICSVGDLIVVILEDFHWVDTNTQNLITSLIEENVLKNLCIIVTSRQEKHKFVSSALNLSNSMKRQGINLKTIELNNFDVETVNTIVSDALFVPAIESYSITSVIYRKTLGNAFFVQEMLLSLFKKKLLFFCKDTAKWKWNLSDNDETENILELLRQKILGFSEGMQQALKVASCLGSPFDVSLLKLIINHDKSIEEMLSSSLIVHQKGSESLYRFVHDQVQYAARSLLPKNNSKILFYIGNKLWKLLTWEELRKNIFVVAKLLYMSVELEKDKKRRHRIAEFLSEAGKRAMEATAFKQAFSYFRKSIELLSIDCWELDYELSIKLYQGASKAAYSVSDYESMHMFISQIVKNSQDPLHLVQSYCLQIRFYNDTRQFELAISASASILKKIDRDLDINSLNELHISKEVIKTRNMLSYTPMEKILALSEMKDNISLSVMMIYTELLYSSFFSHPQLFFFISARMIQLTIMNGLSKFASYPFCCFGSFFCLKGDEAGYEFGKIALNLLQITRGKELIPKVTSSFYTRISPFYESIHKSFDPLLNSFKVGLEVGLNEDSAQCAHIYCGFSFMCGRSLTELLNEIEKIRGLLRQDALLPGFLIIHQATKNLLGMNQQNPVLLQGDIFDFTVLFQPSTKKYDSVRPLLYCGIVAYILNDHSASFKFLQGYRPFEHLILNTAIHPFFLFYEGLATLSFAKHLQESDQIRFISTVRENIKKLKGYCDNAVENYLNKVFMLEAEVSILTNDTENVIENYETAISLSEEFEFIHEKAISCERLGIFVLSFDEAKGSQLLMESYFAYQKWGAYEKLNYLTKAFPCIFSNKNKSIPFRLGGFFHLDIDCNSYDSVSQVTPAEASIMRSAFNDTETKKRIKLQK